MVAAIWEGLTLVPAAPAASADEFESLLKDVDARAGVVAAFSAHAGDSDHQFCADWCSGPLSSPIRLRVPRSPSTPQVRLLLRTSGSAGAGKWIGLSEENITSVIDSHLPLLGFKEADTCLLSVLPWHHSYGLILDLLPALLSGCEIHRDPNSGRNPDALLAAYAQAGITHLSAVPLTVRRLMSSEAGSAFLRSLHGGVVGGAPIDSTMSQFLKSTRLRAGYGQTEASPGITLGRPGYFPEPNYIGKPVGCEVRIDETFGTLQFRGANACLGFWFPGRGLQELDLSRWQDTGDIVRPRADGTGDFTFVARIDDSFKLSNGRFVMAGFYEARIREMCPYITDNLLLLSRNGESLELISDAALPSKAIGAALGAMRPLLSAVHEVSADLFVKTAKGNLDRIATLASVESHAPPIRRPGNQRRTRSIIEDFS